MAHTKPKLSGGMERRWRDVERADSIIAKVTPEVLADLHRRRQASAQADGFKSGNLGSGGVATSTESAALSGLPDDPNEDDDWRKHQRKDFIGDSIESAIAQLDVATRALREYDRLINPVLNAADAFKERKSSVGPCHGCGRTVPGTPNDRLKSGYCTSVKDVPWSGCYERWISDGRPDRPRFESVMRDLSRRTGYEVDELDHLVATGVLPSPSA